MTGLALLIPPELIDEIAALVEERLAAHERREYLDSAGAAAYLGISRGRLDKLSSGAIVTTAAIPFRWEDRRRVYVRQQLDAWIDSGGSALA